MSKNTHSVALTQITQIKRNVDLSKTISCIIQMQVPLTLTMILTFSVLYVGIWVIDKSLNLSWNNHCEIFNCLFAQVSLGIKMLIRRGVSGSSQRIWRGFWKAYVQLWNPIWNYNRRALRKCFGSVLRFILVTRRIFKLCLQVPPVKW